MLERTLPPGFGVPAVALELAPAALCEASLAITLEREIRGLRPGRTFAFGGIDGFTGEDDVPRADRPTILVAAVVRDIGGPTGGGLRG